MNATTAMPTTPATASGSVGYNLRFEVSLNGAFGLPLLEEPIDFEAAEAAYPSDAKPVDEADWSVGGTPAGI